ncbi:hypothetical protein D3C71_235160 [compost metagenome]
MRILLRNGIFYQALQHRTESGSISVSYSPLTITVFTNRTHNSLPTSLITYRAIHSTKSLRLKTNVVKSSSVSYKACPYTLTKRTYLRHLGVTSK